MLRNYFTLYHLATELREILEQGYVFEVFSQQRNEITISFITRTGDHLQLIVITGHPDLCVYTREGLNRKQRNTVDLMPEVTEKQISSIAIDPCDRIIHVVLEEDFVIVLQLFSAKTNVLLKKNETVIRTCKDSIAPCIGHTKRQPLPRPEILRSLETLANDPQSFSERYGGHAGDTVSARLQSMLPGFDKKLVRELLRRCGEARSENILHETFCNLFYELLDPAPSVDTSGEHGPEFSILHHPPDSSVSFDSVMEGLAFYSRKRWQFNRTRTLIRELDDKLKQRLKKIDRELENFKPEKLSEQADDYELNGHLLIANLYSQARNTDRITVSNVFDPNGTLKTISLKPELNLQQNAALLFEKAAKARDKIKGGRKRNTLVAQQKSDLLLLIEKVKHLSTPKDVKHFQEKNLSLLNNTGLGGIAGKSPERAPFRTFRLTDKTVLYVGKNAKNNEKLTFAFAKPHDIWLHARGTAGSHCILRGATMQQTDEIRRAAEIAAFYSSAKHSELVPVMYTEKKYIRRARNLPPGQVVTDRENVIMVKPSRECK